MRKKPTLDLGPNAFDELFKGMEDLREGYLPRLFDIPIDLIDDFPDHPFKVKRDEDMDQLVESIRERGLITPVTLRPKEDGRYEMVSGHRRKEACKLAGLSSIKADVREMSQDEAIILMVESNLQRTVILPSEKAIAYKMRMEAMKRQGKRSDLTCRPMGDKSDNQRAGEVLGSIVGESERQIQRYVRLTELVPELLDLVDEGKIALRPAVELSYIPKEEQDEVYEQIVACDCTPSHAQTIRIRNLSGEGKLSNRAIESIMSEEKPNQKERLHIPYDLIKEFLPREISYKEICDYIRRALEFYQDYHKTSKSKAE